MKTITVNSFERSIMYHNAEYVMCPALDIKKAAKSKEVLGFKCLIVQIKLHPSLKGRTDLHGGPYKPSQLLFVSKQIVK